MPKLLQSPRMRRRVFWIGLALAAAGTAGGLIALLPNTTPRSPAPTVDEGPAQTVAQANTRLRGADRRAIDGLLARFVPAAVERRSPAQAWALAGPELKATTTLKDWKAGNSPVPYYPVREKSFTGWPVVDVERNRVTLSLLLHPRRGVKLGDYTFAVQAIRLHRRWLVNRIYTIAINNPVRGSKHEVGPADFQAPSGSPGVVPTKPRLGNSWLVPIIAVLALALMAPLGLGSFVFVRSRRRRRQIAAEGRSELPPLPSSFRSK